MKHESTKRNTPRSGIRRLLVGGARGILLHKQELMKEKRVYPLGPNGLAPAEVQYTMNLPAHFDRPAIRRYVKQAKKHGLFYNQDPANPHRITLAFESEAVRDRSAAYFEAQLLLNNLTIEKV